MRTLSRHIMDGVEYLFQRLRLLFIFLTPSLLSAQQTSLRFLGLPVLILSPLAIDLAAAPQNPEVMVGSGSGLAGYSVDLPVKFTAGVTGVTVLQFDLTLPAGVTSPNPPLVTTGSTAAAAGKSASSSLLPTGGVRVLIFGLNQNAIGDGPIALVRLNIATGTAPGTLPVGITGIVASDAGGNAVTTLGTAGSVVVTAPGGPPSPSSGRIFIPSITENAETRTNLGINNLSEGFAQVKVTLADSNGSVLGSKAVSVPPNGLVQINRVIRDIIGNPSVEMRGSIYLDSDQPVSAWASQIENATNDPSLLISRQAGSTRLLIPSAANTSRFSSSLVIMNLGQATGVVSIKAYGTDGVVLGQTLNPLPIAPLGNLSFASVLAELGITDNYGPIEINSVNDVPLIATSRVASKNGSGGFFEGISYGEAALFQIIPHVIDTLELRTNLGINNPNGQAANVEVRLVNQTGKVISVLPATIPPKGLTQINNVIRQLIGSADVTNTEGYLQLESTQPVIAWVSEIDNTTNDPGFAISKAVGASHLLVPSATNVGAFKSSLAVVNAGDLDADVEIRMRDTMGNPQGDVKAFKIPPRGFLTSRNILEALGVSNSFGPLEIVSKNGQPLLAVSRVYSSSGTGGFLVAQPVE